MKKFTADDIEKSPFENETKRIRVCTGDLIEAPLPWQKLGLSETASGYGSKLTSSRKIHFEGKERRLYVTQYGNAGSVWFKWKGEKVFVS